MPDYGYLRQISPFTRPAFLGDTAEHALDVSTSAVGTWLMRCFCLSITLDLFSAALIAGSRHLCALPRISMVSVIGQRLSWILFSQDGRRMR